MTLRCSEISRIYNKQESLYLQRKMKNLKKKLTEEEESAFEPTLRALIDAGRIVEARQFLEWTRNASRYSERLRLYDELAYGLLANNSSHASVPCSAFGCDEAQIRKCAEIGKDEQRETGDCSPEERLSMSADELRGIGLYQSEKKGSHRVVISDFDVGKFSNYFCRGFKLSCDDQTGLFNIYRDCYWQVLQQKSPILPKLFYGMVERVAPSCWSSYLEKPFLNAIKVKSLSPTELEPADNYLNVQNGLIDLTTFKLKKHTWKINLTSIIPITYDKTADCPFFKQALLTISDNDPSWVSVFQEILGYMLDPTTLARKMFIFIGTKAQNGKSFLCDCIEALVGSENVSNLPLAQFQSRFGPHSLVNKMVNISAETDTSHKLPLQIQNLKSVISGDAIFVEEKNVQGYKYRARAKIVAAMNDFPDISHSPQAFIDRVLVLPFDVRFSRNPKDGEVQADIHLMEKILTELPGILNFALEGLKRLKAQNYVFSKCQRCEEAENQLRLKVDVVHRFIEERLVAKTGKTRTEDVAQDFTKFCDDEGYKDMASWSVKKVRQELEKAFNNYKIPYDFYKTGGLSYLRGAALVDDSGPELDDSIGDLEDDGTSDEQTSVTSEDLTLPVCQKTKRQM